MSILAVSYDTKEAIPKGYEALYTEVDGKWNLTGVIGLRSQADIDAKEANVRAERLEHKKTKDKLATATQTLAAFGEKTPEEILAQLDRIEELEAAAGDKLDKAKIDEIADKRVKQATAPLERKLNEALKQVADLTIEKDKLTGSMTKRDIRDAVMKEATEAKITSSALDDVLLYAERDFEFVDGKLTHKETGNSPKDWLIDQKKAKPHWWPPSVGAGAGGGQGGAGDKNPWSSEHWNLTEQGRIMREKGQPEAEKMATAAGVTLGATGPKTVTK